MRLRDALAELYQNHQRLFRAQKHVRMSKEPDRTRWQAHREGYLFPYQAPSLHQGCT